MNTETSTQATATAKRAVRDALKGAGVTFLSVTACATYVQVLLPIGADPAAALAALPGATSDPEFSRVVYVAR